MTREEQIKQGIIEYYGGLGYQSGMIRETFKTAVKWADRTMIARGCEWIEDIDFEMTYIDGEGLFDKEQFINDFRKAMEE